MTTTIINQKPTVSDIISNISEIVSNTTKEIAQETEKLYAFTNNERTIKSDSYTTILSFGNESGNVKSIYVFIDTNIKTGDYSTLVSTSVEDGLLVLYKNISKFPMFGLNKYLPEIIKSTCRMLG